MSTISDQNYRKKEIIFLFVLTFVCFSLSVFRMVYTGTKHYGFLNWNLFLAMIPWLITSFVMAKPDVAKSKLMLVLVLGVWLLFFPNAPYILTDLFHLRLNSGMPVWFDLVLILSFAWTGLLFGFFSLWDLEKLLAKNLKKNWITPISMALLFLTGFGIYLGRFLRWNSWDIISKPQQLMYDIGDRFINPTAHPKTWGVTLFMWLFLGMLYFSFRMMRKRGM